jgi:hypothetical protein
MDRIQSNIGPISLTSETRLNVCEINETFHQEAPN